MFQRQSIESSYAVVFIDDPNNPNIRAPDYKTGQAVLANESTISLAIQSYVDGPFVAAMGLKSDYDDESQPVHEDQLIPVFRGVIEAPNRRLVLSTADEDDYITIDTNTDRPTVEIYVDEPGMAAYALILIS